MFNLDCFKLTGETFKLYQEQENIQCTRCLEIFSGPKALKSHKRYCHKSVVCAKCGKTLSNRYQLAIHERCVHGKEEDKKFTCDTCGKSFHLKAALKKHQVTHQTDRPFLCTLCGSTYKSAKVLQMHTQNVHKGKKRKNENNCIYHCKVCDKKFHLKQIFDNHVMTHGAETPYHCKQCDAKYKSPASLRSHVRGVHRGKSRRPADDSLCKFECVICKKKFHMKPALTRHLLVHSDERPWKCKHCSSEFKRRDCLMDHIKRSHEKAK